MSRRESPIQRHTHTMVSSPPATERIQYVVTPTSASVIPAAVSSGRIEGPGRWTLLAGRLHLLLDLLGHQPET